VGAAFSVTDSLDEKLLEFLMRIQEEKKLDYSLFIDDKTFALIDAQIIKSPVPVNRPTWRGGVYFSKNYVYKIKGIINDPSIIPFLSTTMLGPNTEFCDILVTTNANIENKPIIFNLYTNLTNSKQSSSTVELNMTIIRLEKR